MHEGAEAQERAERDGHFAQGRFAGHQAGDEQEGGEGRDARDQRDQRQAEGPAQDAEHEHEFDVAEPHAVHAAQAFEDKKYGEERPAAHKAAEKGVRPVHAEGEDGGGHGQHCPAERDAVGEDEAFQIDARGDDEHSREHEIDGKGERGAETPCQKAGRQAGQEFDERIPDMDGLVAAGALAALVDYANTKRRDHIITIEDPIEFVHQSKSCLVNQREIGRDSRSFGTALRSALREDPDIILVGEMRDLETISLALEAAETGHLVFATLHTISAPKTIDRIIEVFPPEEQAQIRTSLSESIQAIIAQTLFKRADKKGRVPALEIMFGIPSVRNMIRESKTFQLPSVLQTNRNVGMQTMDDDIERLLMQRIIAPEAALVHAQDKGRLREAIGKLK